MVVERVGSVESDFHVSKLGLNIEKLGMLMKVAEALHKNALTVNDPGYFNSRLHAEPIETFAFTTIAHRIRFRAVPGSVVFANYHG